MSEEDLPTDIKKWLKTLPDGIYDPNARGIYQVQNGLLIGEIVKLLKPQSTFQLLHESDTEARKKNWDILTKALSNINISLSSAEKTKLINGYRSTGYEILQKLMALTTERKKQQKVDISQLTAAKDLSDSANLLQFLLLQLMKLFNLTSKESVALLAHDGRYLAHILAKGLKGDFVPIEHFYSSLSKNITILLKHISDKESRQFTFKALKPGMISKGQRVAMLSLDFFNNLLRKMPGGWQSFKNYLASTAFLAIRRHKNLLQKVISLIIDVGEFSKDTIQVIKENSDEQDFLPAFSEVYRQAANNDKIGKIEEMEGYGQLVETVIGSTTLTPKGNQKPSINMEIMIRIMETDSRILEQLGLVKMLTSLVDKLKSKTPSVIPRVNAIIFLFQSLATLGRIKNPLAPTIYKSIIGLMPEMLMQPQEGEVYFSNLNSILLEFPKIPASLLLETLSSAYSQHEQNIHLSTQHMEILQTLNNSDLDLKNTLLLLDVCTKIQLGNADFAMALTDLVCDLASRFSDEELLMELLHRYVKVSLAIYYANEKKKEPKRKSLVTGKAKEKPEEVVLRLKNSVIWQMLDRILKLKLSVGEQALPLIGFTVIQLRNLGGQRHQMLQKLLSHFGNPEEVIKEFEPSEDKPTPMNENTQDDFPSPDKKPIKPYSTSKMPNITPKVLQGLEKYHNSYRKKIEKSQLLQKQRLEQSTKWQHLKKSMQIRMLQQGLPLRDNQQIDLIFDFDSRQRQQKLQKPHKNNEVSYFDLDLQEDRDIRALQYLLRRYHKVIRFMYVKYGNSIVDGKQVSYFDEVAQKAQVIKAADVWKMIRQHSLDEYLSIFECQQLIKLVNYKSGNKQDPLQLDFTGFEKTIVQLAVWMFSRPPKDLRSNPPALLVEQMFRLMREKCDRTSTNPQLYDDPDTAYFSEGEVIRDLNRKLVQNPNHILPEGYKKIVEKKVDFEYKLFLEAVGPSYKDTVEILDEILYEQFGFHIIQPFTKVTTKAKARPALFYASQRSSNAGIQDNTVSQERLRVRSEIADKTKLSQTLRLEVARFPMKERTIATKVAGVLEEILTAVEFGHDQLGQKYKNTSLKSKEERDQETRRLKEQEDQRRRQRQEELKKQLSEIKEKKEQKQRQEEQKKQKQEQKRREQQEKRKAKQQELKSKLQEYQSKKKQDETLKQQQQSEKVRKQKELQEKKKRQAEETKRKLEEAKKKREEQEKKKKQEEDEQKKKKKAYQQKLFKQKQKQMKQKIQQHKKGTKAQDP